MIPQVGRGDQGEERRREIQRSGEEREGVEVGAVTQSPTGRWWSICVHVPLRPPSLSLSLPLPVLRLTEAVHCTALHCAVLPGTVAITVHLSCSSSRQVPPL